ncbi:hypothetical protein [uncultured Cohaesibacter sp.]|uniref:hypothetical protein n=1 Tax=uncultured Cohaesibacter sp. TaxID=1002546 RepID=UPI003748009F
MQSLKDSFPQFVVLAVSPNDLLCCHEDPTPSGLCLAGIPVQVDRPEILIEADKVGPRTKERRESLDDLSHQDPSQGGRRICRRQGRLHWTDVWRRVTSQVGEIPSQSRHKWAIVDFIEVRLERRRQICGLEMLTKLVVNPEIAKIVIMAAKQVYILKQANQARLNGQDEIDEKFVVFGNLPTSSGNRQRYFRRKRNIKLI